MNELKQQLEAKEVLTLHECGLYVGRNEMTVRRWIKEGKLDAHRNPLGHWRVKLQDLKKAMAANEKF